MGAASPQVTSRISFFFLEASSSVINDSKEYICSKLLLGERAVSKLNAVKSRLAVPGFHIWLKRGSVMLTVFLFTADMTVH